MNKLKKIAPTIVSLLFASNAFAQALEVTPIPFGERAEEQPGMLSPVPVVTNDLTVEMGFYIDSAKVEHRIGYRCEGYVANGGYLVDRYPSNYRGGFYMATVGNGRLCWMDRPWYGPEAAWATDVEIEIEPDVCHDLRVTRTAERLTIEVDGREVFSTAPGWWAAETWTYNSQDGQIAIGREKNMGPDRLDTTWTGQFPGYVTYYRENGVDLLERGRLTGGAFFGATPCPQDEPEPEFPACAEDSTSVECACALNPHPACYSCPAP